LNGAGLYMLDTNIISYMMREPSGAVAQRALAMDSEDARQPMCTSVVVQCELLFGLMRRTNPTWTDRYHRVMASLDVKPLEESAATHYAALRSALQTRGTPLDSNDLLIAAHALSLDAILVSADAAFARVPGLKLENWLVEQHDSL